MVATLVEHWKGALNRRSESERAILHRLTVLGVAAWTLRNLSSIAP